MSRYSLAVRADMKPMVESTISRLPSHYITAWVKRGGTTTTHYSEPVVGAVETQLPVGQLATLVHCATPEGETPTHYICSGEFHPWQLAAVKDAMKNTKLGKDETWWEGNDPALLRARLPKEKRDKAKEST